MGRARLHGYNGCAPLPTAMLPTELSNVAKTDVNIVFVGEKDANTEHLAREVHAASLRANGPFVAVDCSAIPKNLDDSLLFGCVSGKFTKVSTEVVGAFVEANGGTLFLDEIGALSSMAQARLVLALDERQVSAIGSSAPRSVDVRLIAATSRDLRSMVEARQLRQDLCERLVEATVKAIPIRAEGSHTNNASECD
jgi:transcriptional regulator with PAS, ATPase and Fis domain